MKLVTRTTNPNGTYRYEVDGEVLYEASKVLYTHASEYAVGDLNHPVLFHRTEAAAAKAKGYPSSGWVKVGTSEIQPS